MELSEALRESILDIQGRNLGVNGRRDYYGIEVENVAADGSSFDVKLTFKAGETYCCLESGCHFAADEDWWWKRLRNRLLERDIIPLPMTIGKLTGVVEDGTKWTLGKQPITEERAYTYEHGPYREDQARTRAKIKTD